MMAVAAVVKVEVVKVEAETKAEMMVEMAAAMAVACLTPVELASWVGLTNQLPAGHHHPLASVAQAATSRHRRHSCSQVTMVGMACLTQEAAELAD